MISKNLVVTAIHWTEITAN